VALNLLAIALVGIVVAAGIAILVRTGSTANVLKLELLPVAIYVPLLVRAVRSDLPVNEAAPSLLVVLPLVALVALDISAGSWFGDLGEWTRQRAWLPLLFSYLLSLVATVVAAVVVGPNNYPLYVASATVLVSLVPLFLYWGFRKATSRTTP
jgi:hypothetical protein